MWGMCVCVYVCRGEEVQLNRFPPPLSPPSQIHLLPYTPRDYFRLVRCCLESRWLIDLIRLSFCVGVLVLTIYIPEADSTIVLCT